MTENSPFRDPVPEKISFTIIFKASSSSLKMKILDHLEETEGHRVIRFQETTEGAIQIRFDHMEQRLQTQILEEIKNIDQAVEIRGSLTNEEKLI